MSYALGDGRGISVEVRNHILSIVKEVGFRPNRVAQGLRSGRMNMIGLLLADIANPFYPELASGVVAAAEQRGCLVFVSQIGDGGPKRADAARSLVDRNCDGLIFTSVVSKDAELLAELRKQGTPFVYASRKVDAVPADWVGIDNRAAAREVAELLLEGGRKRIAVLGGPRASSVSADRVRGASYRLARAGQEATPAHLRFGELTRESGRARMRQLLEEMPGTDAVICGNDMIALGALDHCYEHGIAVPRGMAVVGFDDMSFASAGPLQLTTVAVPRQRIGERAVEMLFERIGGYEGDWRAEVLPHQLQIRATASRGQGGARR